MPSAWQNKPLSEPPLASSRAFAALYEETHLLIFRYIYGLHGGPVQAVEDMAAETFTRAWKARKRFEGERPAAVGWLLRIARNLVIDARRKERFRGVPVDLEAVIVPEPGMTPEERTVLQDQVEQLWQAMEALPEDRREMLVLRYMLAWRVKDIAAHLDVPDNTVSQTILRALKKVRQEMERRVESK
jgi:RNA polymerase sigma-70 factor (ECF subfamily)